MSDFILIHLTRSKFYRNIQVLDLKCLNPNLLGPLIQLERKPQECHILEAQTI